MFARRQGPFATSVIPGSNKNSLEDIRERSYSLPRAGLLFQDFSVLPFPSLFTVGDFK